MVKTFSDKGKKIMPRLQGKRDYRKKSFSGLGIVVILILLTILGIASISPAVIAHEGSTLLVVFNALRLLDYKK